MYIVDLQYIVNNFASIRFDNTNKVSITLTTAVTGFFLETDSIITDMCIYVNNAEDDPWLSSLQATFAAGRPTNLILKCDHDSIKSFGQIFFDPMDKTIRDTVYKIISPRICSDIIYNINSNGFIAVREKEKYRKLFSSILLRVMKEGEV